MANKDHCQLITQGVEVWNTWRAENPDILPDLRGAQYQFLDCPGLNLAGAILTNAIFRYASLQKANLSGAIMSGVIFEGAHLEGVNFTGAYLKKASFGGARLDRAVLESADLWCASFSSANMTDVNLTDTNLTASVLTNANLNGAILTRAELNGSLLMGIKYNSSTIFPRRWIQGCLNAAERVMRNPLYMKGVAALLEELNGGLFNRNGDGDQPLFKRTLFEGGNDLSWDEYRRKTGLSADQVSPEEQFFFLVREGDTPVTNTYARLLCERAQCILEP